MAKQLKYRSHYFLILKFPDGTGKRIRKITASETIVFVYDGLGKLVAEYSTNGPVQNPTVNYTATDPLGSTVRVARETTELVDDAFVIRGGQNLPENFARGSGVSIDSAGNLSGVSVNSGNGLSVQELSVGIPHNQIGVTTVGNIRALGGNVVRNPTAFNPNHCILCGITPNQASGLFRPTIPRP